MPTHHIASGALVSAPATVSVADEPYQFLSRAEQLCAGAVALAPLGPQQAGATIFLASWCLELALKAYLATKGQRKAELRSIQHDLSALWVSAGQHGLSIAVEPPRWCELLAATHKAPYHQRYPTDIAASVSPGDQELVKELVALMAVIRGAIA